MEMYEVFKELDEVLSMHVVVILERKKVRSKSIQECEEELTLLHHLVKGQTRKIWAGY